MDTDIAHILDILAEFTERNQFASTQEIAERLVGPNGDWRTKAPTVRARFTNIRRKVGAEYFIQKDGPAGNNDLSFLDVDVLRTCDLRLT